MVIYTEEAYCLIRFVRYRSLINDFDAFFKKINAHIKGVVWWGISYLKIIILKISYYYLKPNIR